MSLALTYIISDALIPILVLVLAIPTVSRSESLFEYLKVASILVENLTRYVYVCM